MEVERQDKEAQAAEGRAFRLVTQLFTRWGTKAFGPQDAMDRGWGNPRPLRQAPHRLVGDSAGAVPGLAFLQSRQTLGDEPCPPGSTVERLRPN